MTNILPSILPPLVSAAIVATVNIILNRRNNFETRRKMELDRLERKIEVAAGIRTDAQRYIGLVNEFIAESEACRLDREKNPSCDISRMAMNEFPEISSVFLASLASVEGSNKLDARRGELDVSLREYKVQLKELLSSTSDANDIQPVLDALEEVLKSGHEIKGCIDGMYQRLTSEETRVRRTQFKWLKRNEV